MDNLGEILHNLKDFFIASSQNEQIESRITKLYENGLDNETYISIITMLEQMMVSDSAKITFKYYLESNLNKNDRIITNPVFQSLFIQNTSMQEELRNAKMGESEEVSRLNAIIKNLTSIISESQANKCKLESKLKSSNEMITNFKARINETVIQITDLQAKNQSLIRENKVLAKRHGNVAVELQNELDLVRNELNIKIDKIRALEEQNRSTLLAYAQEVNVLKEQIVEHSNSAPIEINHYYEDLEMKSKEIEMITSLTMRLNEMLLKKKKTIQELAVFYDKSKKMDENFMSRVITDRISQLEDEIERIKQKSEQSSRDAKEQKQYYDSLMTQKNEIESSTQENLKSIEELTIKLQILKKQLENSQIVSKETHSQIDVINEEFAYKSRQLTLLTEEMNSIKEEFKSKQKEIKEMDLQMKQMSYEKEKLKESIEESVKHLENTQINIHSINEEVIQMNIQKETIISTLAELDSINEQKQTRIKELDLIISQMKETYQEKEDEAKIIEEQLIVKEQEKNSLETKLNEISSSLKIKQEQILEMESAISRIEPEIIELTNKEPENIRNYEEIKEKFDILEREFNEKMNEKGEIGKKIEDKESKYEELMQKMNLSTIELEKMEKENRRLNIELDLSISEQQEINRKIEQQKLEKLIKEKKIADNNTKLDNMKSLLNELIQETQQVSMKLESLDEQIKKKTQTYEEVSSALKELIDEKESILSEIQNTKTSIEQLDEYQEQTLCE